MVRKKKKKKNCHPELEGRQRMLCPQYLMPCHKHRSDPANGPFCHDLDTISATAKWEISQNSSIDRYSNLCGNCTVISKRYVITHSRERLKHQLIKNIKHCVHKSVPCVYISIAALQIGSSVPFF